MGDIQKFIKNVCPCISQKKPSTRHVAQLQSIATASPLEVVSVDYVKVEKGKGGYEYILVVIDQFIRFAQAYPSRNKSTITAANKLFNDFVPRFGIPGRIHSDQGGEFESRVIADLNRLLGIEKSRTTPYHPQGNGTCERMNRTLLSMLRTLPENLKSKWPEHINKLVHAYNSMRHSATGYSPFRLMFGREPRLPIDLWIKYKEGETVETYSKFAKEQEFALKEAYKIASSNSQKQNQSSKMNFDKRAKLSTLQVGDRVLVKNTKMNKEGPSKLVTYWEQAIYVIVEVMDGGVVYKVKKDGKGKGRVLHRNMIFLVDDNFELSTTSEKHDKEYNTKVKVDGNSQDQGDRQNSEETEEKNQDATNSDSRSGDDGMIISSKAKVPVRVGTDDAVRKCKNKKRSMREKGGEDNVRGTNTEEDGENRNAENPKEAGREENVGREKEEGSKRERNEEDNVIETDAEEDDESIQKRLREYTKEIAREGTDDSETECENKEES